MSAPRTIGTSEQIRCTLSVLRALRDLAAPPRPMQPVHRRYGARVESAADARVLLDFWVYCAVQRRGGVYGKDGYSPTNHRGRPARRWDDDYQRGLVQDRNDVLFAARCGRVYQWRTDLVRARLGHLLVEREG